MKKMNSLMILVITVFVMLTCQKEDPILPKVDEATESLETQDIKQKQEHGKIDDLIVSLKKENYEANHYQVNAALGRDGENYLPSFEVQQKFLSLMLEQDAENPFLEEFLNTYGFPIWEQSFYKPTTDDEIIVVSVPIMKDEAITGVLKFYDLPEDSDKVRFISHETIEETVNTQDYGDDLPLIRSAVLDMLVFETNIYRSFNDVYSNWLRTHLGRDSGSGRVIFWCETVTVDWWQITTADGVMIGNPTYLGSQEVPTGECYTISGPSHGGGGGGDHNPMIPNPANEGNNEEEHIVDHLDGDFPCASEVLAEFSTIENELIELISDIFNTSDEVRLNVYASQQGDTSGEAAASGHPLWNFDVDVTLNSTDLSCTKDFILATILHEALHGYIDYHRSLVEYGEMTQQQFDEMFPLYIFTDEIWSQSSSFAHHSIMANDYLNSIANVLQAYNSNLSPETAIALAWEGLQETMIWNTLSDEEQNDIGLINMAARCEAAEGYEGENNFINCEN